MFGPCSGISVSLSRGTIRHRIASPSPGTRRRRHFIAASHKMSLLCELVYFYRAIELLPSSVNQPNSTRQDETRISTYISRLLSPRRPPVRDLRTHSPSPRSTPPLPPTRAENNYLNSIVHTYWLTLREALLGPGGLYFERYFRNMDKLL